RPRRPARGGRSSSNQQPKPRRAVFKKYLFKSVISVLVMPDLIPSLHPIFPAADNLERLVDLDAVPSTKLISSVYGGEFNRDGCRPPDTTHGRVDLLSVEFPPFVVQRSSPVHLFPDNDTAPPP